MFVLARGRHRASSAPGPPRLLDHGPPRWTGCDDVVGRKERDDDAVASWETEQHRPRRTASGFAPEGAAHWRGRTGDGAGWAGTGDHQPGSGGHSRTGDRGTVLSRAATGA